MKVNLRTQRGIDKKRLTLDFEYECGGDGGMFQCMELLNPGSTHYDYCAAM